jgi:hypothetical protein
VKHRQAVVPAPAGQAVERFGDAGSVWSDFAYRNAEGPSVLPTEGPLRWDSEVGVDGFEPPTSAL